jgi:hypothetical protein
MIICDDDVVKYSQAILVAYKGVVNQVKIVPWAIRHLGAVGNVSVISHVLPTADHVKFKVNLL